MNQLPKARYEFAINKGKLQNKAKLLLQALNVSKRISERNNHKDCSSDFAISSLKDEVLNGKTTFYISFYTKPINNKNQ